MGKNDQVRLENREASTSILRTVANMRETMINLWDQMTEQTLAINRLCNKNGFNNADDQSAYQMYEKGQTFAVESFTGLCKSELNHIENIADIFLKNNKE